MGGEVADVLIIGAGASGSVAAKHLTESGFDVVMLEQGDWWNPDKFPGNFPEYELLNSGAFNPNPNARDRDDDYPIDLSNSDQPIYMYSGVGGSTVFFAGVWSRALPSDFRVRTMDGIADDWPIGYQDLAPFYHINDQDFGASGLHGNPAFPDGGANPPLPAHPILPTGRRMAEAMNRLGWHWWPGNSAIPSRPWKNQAQCVRYGICRAGCTAGSKGSVDITHIPYALSAGLKLITGARVAEITVDDKGLASGATYFKNGKEHHQSASVVILAANGIGTPRLLLMSTSNRFPDGLANSSGVVGQNLMIHPFAGVIGLYDEPFDDWIGPAGIQIESMEFYESDSSRGFARGSKWHIMGTGGPLEMAMRRARGEGMRDEPFWGEQFVPKMKEAVGRSIDWIVHVEDLPEPTNAVTLDPELKDSDGLSAPKVTYATAENTHVAFDFAIARALEAHEEAGAEKAWVSGRNMSSGHNLGTARMGDDPAASVVDGTGRAHDVPNLYIIDGSVFTTSTGTNPTATICAIAKRTATYLVESRGDQLVSG
jgi:choline dehydrogenase-like flavoprotein